MTTVRSQHPERELFVHRIEELSAEIRHAMAAISGNRLQALEESLWRQEVSCTGLKHLLGTAQRAARVLAGDTQLQASLDALHQLNQSYTELLRQVQASNHLLDTLYRSYILHAHERTHPANMRCSLEA